MAQMYEKDGIKFKQNDIIEIDHLEFGIVMGKVKSFYQGFLILQTRKGKNLVAQNESYKIEINLTKRS